MLFERKALVVLISDSIITAKKKLTDLRFVDISKPYNKQD
ncbi:hypothetical protein HMP0015_2943 [Acinetobacter haemolyticus ATCC 19194]|uniref:Uncharacterized protein n=1 Tax=Acinetobacter haemolyticus ATCC 19194 TaxID=707232 RepID=D4XTA1_ACIHA|nr:hypothetical protein HMP0015_2943 [Acinetobacter haemolyticus ATCC 19194]